MSPRESAIRDYISRSREEGESHVAFYTDLVKELLAMTDDEYIAYVKKVTSDYIDDCRRLRR